MDDYRHLRKAHENDDEDRELLTSEYSPSEAKECLDEMKHISKLISDVSYSKAILALINAWAKYIFMNLYSFLFRALLPS